MGSTWEPNPPNRPQGFPHHSYLGEQAEAADAADDAVHPGKARARASRLQRDREAPSMLQPPLGLLPARADGAQGRGLGRRENEGRGYMDQGCAMHWSGSKEVRTATKVKRRSFRGPAGPQANTATFRTSTSWGSADTGSKCILEMKKWLGKGGTGKAA